MRGLEPDEELREHIGRDRRRRPEHELVGEGQALDGARPVLQRAHSPIRVGQEGPPRLGEEHAPAAAAEERAADLGLERAQARGQRGLRDEQRLRRAAEVGAPRHLEEALDLCQLHVAR